ncbi:MAG: imidazoleglycerol-phosphate dehydratase HisB [Chloroflexota bacterium]
MTTTAARTATRTRRTSETTIEVSVDLDGTGMTDVLTGVGFYDHLLTSLGHHSLIDLRVRATGDLHIDEHHTVEDVALVLGDAISGALGDRVGIARFGDARVPMDDALASVAIDLSGRPYAVLDLAFVGERVGILQTQNIPHVLESLARTLGANLHATATGRNDHHIAEATFKALARSLRAAVAIDPRRSGVASTKGSLA